MQDRIDLRIAPAIETLDALPSDQLVDLAFIDADKGGYIAYYALRHLIRQGKRPIIRRALGAKELRIVYDEGGTRLVRTESGSVARVGAGTSVPTGERRRR